MFNSDNRKKVVSYLHYNGENNKKLTSEQFVHLYLQCDGFGNIGLKEAMEQDFDWSHVRDSSESAYKRIIATMDKLGIK